MSPFMLPSALKDILRMGLDLDDLDLSISHLQMFARRMKIPFNDTTVIGKLDQHRSTPAGARAE